MTAYAPYSIVAYRITILAELVHQYVAQGLFELSLESPTDPDRLLCSGEDDQFRLGDLDLDLDFSREDERDLECRGE